MKKLFTPGPTNILPEVREELSKDIFHHRMSDYKTLLYEVTEKLKKVYKTKEDVIILTSSGTGSMESSVVNFFNKGDTILVINTGFFGDRFIEISREFDLNVIELKYEWGNTYEYEEVKECLIKNDNIKGVFATHHETSTGVVNNIEKLGNLIKDFNALLIVDCISGLVVHEFEFDKWNVDCALSGSQKGFLLPPGLSFVALSKKAKKMMKDATLPKYYWNYEKYLKYYEIGQNPYTPSISLVKALNVSLEYLLSKGLTIIQDEKKSLRGYLEKELVNMGFTLFIEDESIRGNTLVPVINDKINIDNLVKELDKSYNIQIARGQGIYKDKMLRIGLIGDLPTTEYKTLVEILKNM